MPEEEVSWHMICSQPVFEKCCTDEKFPYLVALARSVNALNFVRSVMNYTQDLETPASKRDRLNSYLFGSAIMYEALILIKTMNKGFRDDPQYQHGLRSLLKDPTAQQIERDHLIPARHKAVFHFDADMFRETIEKGIPNQCLFFSAKGRKRSELHYSYADLVAAEILVGASSADEDFYKVLEDAMQKTELLVSNFMDHAEKLIGENLAKWGFGILKE